MSQDRFKAAYVLDITSKIGRIQKTFDKWNIPYEGDSESTIKPIGEWHLIKDKNEQGYLRAVLQYVVSDCDVEDRKEYGFCFRPELVGEIMQKIHSEHGKDMLEYMFKGGFGNFYPVAYTWDNNEREPVVL